MEAMLSIDQELSVTKDIGMKRMSFDEEKVSEATDVILTWGNPFDDSCSLVNLASGLKAPDDVQKDLLEARSRGEFALGQFVEKRIRTNDTCFYDPIKRCKLKTFATMKAKKICKVNEKAATIRAERGMFAKLLVIREKRDTVSMKELISYSLGPIPWSLALPDGGLVKTVKSRLLYALEANVPHLETLPEGTTFIFDGMVILQQLNTSHLDTFGDISDFIFKRISRGNATSIYFVTDQYLEHSVKEMERRQRGSCGVLHIKLERRDQKTPKQFKKYLADPKNKIELVKFLLNDWSHPKRFRDRIRNRVIYVTVEDKCFAIAVVSENICAVEVEMLCSKQEEADTKVFLCSKHAEQYRNENICIVTVDSDIAIYGVYFADKFTSNIYIEIGSGKSRRILDVKAIFTNIGSSIAHALPALHAFTGNDYTSAFHAIGKIKAYKILKKFEHFQYVFGMIGQDFEFDLELFESVQEFVCALYGLKSMADVNEARYVKLCSRKGKMPEPQQLPPTKDELLHHCKRVSYVTAIIKQALELNVEYPSPQGHGWIITGSGDLEIKWMAQKPAPDSILEMVSCNCKRTKCQSESCSCFAHRLKCTDMCNCSKCENEFDDDDLQSSASDFSDDDVMEMGENEGLSD